MTPSFGMGYADCFWRSTCGTAVGTGQAGREVRCIDTKPRRVRWQRVCNPLKPGGQVMYLGRLMCNEERTEQRTEPQETPSTEIRESVDLWYYKQVLELHELDRVFIWKTEPTTQASGGKGVSLLYGPRLSWGFSSMWRDGCAWREGNAVARQERSKGKWQDGYGRGNVRW